MGLSSLGIFHTIIGVAAIIAALTGFIKYGKINLNALSGKIYFYGTVVTSLTSLGISKHGGFNPGHVFAVFIIILALAAYFLNSKKKNSGRARYFENFWLSFSFFLSLVPTVNETFTRVPVGHPLAKDIKDPVIATTLLVLLVLFTAGSIYQFRRQSFINSSLVA
ncbi:hypothetical protein B0A79_21850 [Flavobacterium piscis]|jgi:uncharacterized membrane protein|uniref:DUF2306 domain-containing protein n=1 Tax=Flavobacterium piscis TaxID=1114874 RepID=A0ABX2XM66_9FLAO|nr:hypothetical protein [Flavobacterium piscis]OCB76760.1 hypothetical protein FLP_05380 [Flavobacterium piscis]OXE97463.1 hypothetical protein B0A79_21850 [Flavobacterium piscis]